MDHLLVPATSERGRLPGSLRDDNLNLETLGGPLYKLVGAPHLGGTKPAETFIPCWETVQSRLKAELQQGNRLCDPYRATVYGDKHSSSSSVVSPPCLGLVVR